MVDGLNTGRKKKDTTATKAIAREKQKHGGEIPEINGCWDIGTKSRRLTREGRRWIQERRVWRAKQRKRVGKIMLMTCGKHPWFRVECVEGLAE